MSIKNIVKDAKTKVTEMGGGEQFIGHLRSLAKDCGSVDPLDFMVDLGEALEKVELQLTSGPGAPEELYASPLDA